MIDTEKKEQRTRHYYECVFGKQFAPGDGVEMQPGPMSFAAAKERCRREGKPEETLDDFIERARGYDAYKARLLELGLGADQMLGRLRLGGFPHPRDMIKALEVLRGYLQMDEQEVRNRFIAGVKFGEQSEASPQPASTPLDCLEEGGCCWAEGVGLVRWDRLLWTCIGPNAAAYDMGEKGVVLVSNLHDKPLITHGKDVQECDSAAEARSLAQEMVDRQMGWDTLHYKVSRRRCIPVDAVTPDMLVEQRALDLAEERALIMKHRTTKKGER